MAFDFFSEDEKKQQQDAQQGGAQQNLGQQSPILTGGTPEQQQPGQGTTSGSFTNLNQYLDANKDLKFGQNVAGRVQGDIDSAKQSADQAGSQFQGAVDQNKVSQDDSLLNLVSSDPTALRSNQQQFDQFTKMRDAQYGGPKDLVDTDYYAPAADKVTKASNTANQTASEGGRKAYLDQQFGSGAGRYDYTPGMQKLDNFLIQNDDGSKQAFENVQQQGRDLSQGFGSLKDTLNAYANQAANQTQATRQNTRNALGIDDQGNYNPNGNGAIQQNLTGLDKEVADRQAALAADKAGLQSAYGSHDLSQLSPQQLQELGIAPDAYAGFDRKGFNDTAFGVKGDLGSYDKYFKGFDVGGGQFYGATPDKYLSFTPDTDVNRGTVASNDEANRLQALSDLAGINNTFITNPPSDIGKYREGNFSKFDKSGFDTDVTNRQSAAKAELQAVLDRYNRIANSGGLVDPSGILRDSNAVRSKYGLGAA